MAEIIITIHLLRAWLYAEDSRFPALPVWINSETAPSACFPVSLSHVYAQGLEMWISVADVETELGGGFINCTNSTHGAQWMAFGSIRAAAEVRRVRFVGVLDEQERQTAHAWGPIKERQYRRPRSHTIRLVEQQPAEVGNYAPSSSLPSEIESTGTTHQQNGDLHLEPLVHSGFGTMELAH
ncbi:hypothetical protein CC80DRAFT_552511 [Byssothecium circinans]|uniref:Uncharacterized protein n=1 Tax=Byssothecium circinans TaxID=147558 RepID=A0A6A5TKZ7_9PLEO|nr:hypothetical protein CC80DRAFT_552511 [Byssothecium circinans]